MIRVTFRIWGPATIAAVLFSAGGLMAQSNSEIGISKIGGLGLIQAKNCTECHTMTGKAEGEKTPMLKAGEGKWLETHMTEHSELVLSTPRSKRRQRKVRTQEAEMVNAYLFQATDAERKHIHGMSKELFAGAFLVAQNCIRCHEVAEKGKDVGPALTKIGGKRDAEWLMKNLVDPKQFSEDSPMPSFEEMPEADRKKIIAYLLTLK